MPKTASAIVWIGFFAVMGTAFFIAHPKIGLDDLVEGVRSLTIFAK